MVEAVLADYRSAPVDEHMRATLAFLEKVTLAPDDVGPDDAAAARRAARRGRGGLTPALGPPGGGPGPPAPLQEGMGPRARAVRAQPVHVVVIAAVAAAVVDPRQLDRRLAQRLGGRAPRRQVEPVAA